MSIIDVHAHYVPAECISSPDYGFTSEQLEDRGRLLMRGGVPLGPFDETIEQLSDISRRLADMDAADIDIQALSVDPGLFFYDVDIDKVLPRTEVLNDALAQVVNSHPERFVAFGTVSLQDVDVAVQQLEYCITALNMSGIAICTNVNGKNLANPEFWPLFEAAEALGATLFIHPYNIAGGDRTRCFAARVVIGNPCETTIALYSLILGGVFERFPLLRAIFAHGGGALPYLSGRIERGYDVRPEIRNSLTQSPLELVRSVYVDTIVHDPRVLRFLVEMWGPQCVVPGTDYPYDMGDDSPRRLVEQAFGTDSSVSDLILRKNAARAMGLARP